MAVQLSTSKDSNQLDHLPDSIGMQLSFLDLGSNQLSALNESFGGLHFLEYLVMEDNQLTSLPESIGKMKKLRWLQMNSNKLTSLPATISQLVQLEALYHQNNHLTSLPGSIGDLEALRVLSLDSNRLMSLPESSGRLRLMTLHLDSNRLTSVPKLNSQNLQELRVAKNQLRTVDLSDMSHLLILSLHDNLLKNIASGGKLGSLEVLLLHSNRLHSHEEICELGLGGALKTLYLHGNALHQIPPCLNQWTSLEVLTLHRNLLSGEVPKTLAELPKLTVLTLHANRLHGSLPEELATAPKLAFFSAHANDLQGPIPPLKLRKDCVNDDSFMRNHDNCDDFASPGPWAMICLSSEVKLHCPKSCKVCNNASARGPVLLLHDNRLSCSLPHEVTGWPEDMRSISLIGNMLGNGSSELPSWVHVDEHQPFLYVSGSEAFRILKRMMLLASVFAASSLLLLGTNGTSYQHILSTKAGSELTRQAHVFLLQTGAALSIVAVCLLALYCVHANYYTCGSGFSSTTVSNFSNPYHGHALVEWAVAVLWSLWIAVGAFFLRRAPTYGGLEVRESTSWLVVFLNLIYSCCWLCIVALLSFPSVAYAVVSAIPSNNTLHLSAWWLRFFNCQAALVMVLVDMFATPRAVALFADATGIRRSMLSMAARLGTMWLAAVLSTFYLTTHCMNGWTHLWKAPGRICCSMFEFEFKNPFSSNYSNFE